MVYKNSNGQPRERCMIAAYSLAEDFGAKQSDIAKVMNCSQSTVSSWIKEARYKRSISELTAEIEDANEYVQQLTYDLHLTDVN